MAVSVGVLALQGGVREHISLLHKAAAYLQEAPPSQSAKVDITHVEVRTPRDLARCDALIIPGGESTTIALIAAQSGLLEPLREFVNVSRNPTWGTCAGLILLAEEANATKKGGQELIGGLAVRVRRNHFGRQIESFVAAVTLPFLAQSAALSAADAAAPFSGVFIRAPIVEELLQVRAAVDASAVEPGGQVASGRAAKAEVEVLGVLPDRATRAAGEEGSAQIHGGEVHEVNNIIAVRQGNIVGTSFHPELTGDIRIHVWWLEQVIKRLSQDVV